MKTKEVNLNASSAFARQLELAQAPAEVIEEVVSDFQKAGELCVEAAALRKRAWSKAFEYITSVDEDDADAVLTLDRWVNAREVFEQIRSCRKLWSYSTISNHLPGVAKAGAIATKKVGTRRFYASHAVVTREDYFERRARVIKEKGRIIV